MTIDRNVTLGVVLTIILQTGGALIWVGGAEARLEALETQAELSPPVNERLARLEEQMQMARQSLIRIEQRLDDKR